MILKLTINLRLTILCKIHHWILLLYTVLIKKEAFDSWTSGFTAILLLSFYSFNLSSFDILILTELIFLAKLLIYEIRIPVQLVLFYFLDPDILS